LTATTVALATFGVVYFVHGAARKVTHAALAGPPAPHGEVLAISSGDADNERAIERTLIELTPTPTPIPKVNYLQSDSGELSTSVITYSDCSGSTPLTHAAAAVDTCFPRLVFLGHNPGVFTAVIDLKVGDLITWWDSNGVAHQFRVVQVIDASGRKVPSYRPGIAAEFRTCITSDGSLNREVETVAA
jgi:hypothetical protein